MDVMKLIQKDLQTPFGIPPTYKFLVSLRFYATGAFQMTIGDCYGLAQQTISKIVKDVSIAIAKLRPQFIKFPSHQEAPGVHYKFYTIAEMPGVIGAIDGTHIPIELGGSGLGNDIELYRNHKGWFSINVQGICNADLEFISLVVRWYGSAHDARIFDNSIIKQKLSSDLVPGYLLGDSGCPCLPYLLTPVNNPNTPSEVAYNSSHISTRSTIERTFGVWKKIFPCLTQSLRNHIETTKVIIIACGVLFNLNRQFKKELSNVEVEIGDQPPSPIPDSPSGLAFRNVIIRQHF